MKLKVNTAQTSWQVSTDDAKDHLRVTHSNDDDYILDLTKAAQAQFERMAGCYLNEIVFELYLDEFPFDDTIYIDAWPIETLTSVQYYDLDNSIQTFADTNYSTDLLGKPPMRLMLNEDVSWPDTYERANAVKITFTTGFTSPETCPEDIIRAIKLIIGEMYAKRNDSVKKFPTVVERIAQTYRYD